MAPGRQKEYQNIRSTFLSVNLSLNFISHFYNITPLFHDILVSRPLGLDQIAVFLDVLEGPP